MSLKSLQEAITAEPLMRKVAMSRTQSPLAQENGVMMLDLNNDYWRSLSALLNHAKDEAQAKEEVI
jgi:hypothetical protein